MIQITLLRREPGDPRWKRFPKAQYNLLVTTKEKTIQCPFVNEEELGSALVLAASKLAEISN